MNEWDYSSVPCSLGCCQSFSTVESWADHVPKNHPKYYATHRENIDRKRGVLSDPDVMYRCLDCGILVSQDEYPYHNSDHTLRKVKVTEVT